MAGACGCDRLCDLEPCAMRGALVQARVKGWSTGPPIEGGACGTLYNIVQDERLNHRLAVTAGVLEAVSAALLRDFSSRRG